MADKSLFGRLQRLFSNNVIVRNVGGKKLKIADTDKVQHIAKSNLIDRFTKLYSSRFTLFADGVEISGFELDLCGICANEPGTIQQLISTNSVGRHYIMVPSQMVNNIICNQ